MESPGEVCRDELDTAGRSPQLEQQETTHPTEQHSPEMIYSQLPQDQLSRLREERDKKAQELAIRRHLLETHPSSDNDFSEDDINFLDNTQIEDSTNAMDIEEKSILPEQPFQDVKTTQGQKKRKQYPGKIPNTTKKTFQIPTKNRYEVLQNLDVTTQQPGTSTSTTSANNQPPPPSTPKIPPITINYTGKYLELNAALKQRLQGEVKAIYRSNQIKYHFDSLADHRAALLFFQELDMPLYTHQPSADRDLQVVIKGIPEEITEEELKNELKHFKFHANLVHQFKKRDPHTRRLIPQPSYCVTLPKGPHNDAIYDIKYMFNTKVTVEDFRSRDGPSQCKRCQKFFHTANYCTMPARCVRCGGHHEAKNCTQPRTEPPKCANCNEVGHPASWRGCPEFQRALRSYHQNRRTTQKQQQSTSSTTGFNWAEAFFPELRKPTGEQPTSSNLTATQPLRDYSQKLKQPKPQRTTEQRSEDSFGLAEIMKALSSVSSIMQFFKRRNILATLSIIARNFNNAPDLLSKLLVLAEGIMSFFMSD